MVCFAVQEAGKAHHPVWVPGRPTSVSKMVGVDATGVEPPEEMGQEAYREYPQGEQLKIHDHTQ